MSRWRLHRGGIVNIWQYTESDVRLLRWTRDLPGHQRVRQVPHAGAAAAAVPRRRPAPDRLEGLRHGQHAAAHAGRLRRRPEPDRLRVGRAAPRGRRRAEYLTCGHRREGVHDLAGDHRLVAVRHRRSGSAHDFARWSPTAPRSAPTQLRDLLGADCLHDEAAFRATIAETVYGVPAARYADLLHLQRTLRNPDVGLKVLEGQLEQILSDALPPLDQAMIEQLATVVRRPGVDPGEHPHARRRRHRAAAGSSPATPATRSARCAPPGNATPRRAEGTGVGARRDHQAHARGCATRRRPRRRRRSRSRRWRSAS